MRFKKQRRKLREYFCCGYPRSIRDTFADDDIYSYRERGISESNATSVIEETYHEDGTKYQDSVDDVPHEKETDSPYVNIGEEERLHMLTPKKEVQTTTARESITIISHPEYEHLGEDMLRIFRCLTDQSSKLDEVMRKISTLPCYFEEFENKLEVFRDSLERIDCAAKRESSQAEDTVNQRQPHQHDERFGSYTGSYIIEAFDTVKSDALRDQFIELQRCTEKMQSCESKDNPLYSAVSQHMSEMDSEIQKLSSFRASQNYKLDIARFMGDPKPTPKNKCNKRTKTRHQPVENIEMAELEHRHYPIQSQYDTLESNM